MRGSTPVGPRSVPRSSAVHEWCTVWLVRSLTIMIRTHGSFRIRYQKLFKTGNCSREYAADFNLFLSPLIDTPTVTSGINFT